MQSLSCNGGYIAVDYAGKLKNFLGGGVSCEVKSGGGMRENRNVLAGGKNGGGGRGFLIESAKGMRS